MMDFIFWIAIGAVQIGIFFGTLYAGAWAIGRIGAWLDRRAARRQQARVDAQVAAMNRMWEGK